ncbi:hypothetical protein FHR36_005900 [Kitasatospora paracochleata]|uniref:Uncharacterized protein n=1 Tax=Kitasatospora paracochleata TaxID=58354 RepID=A0ABT1J6F8_9ACTN|nr:hypothetical protein [Kitasatospora paracochleata]
MLAGRDLRPNGVGHLHVRRALVMHKSHAARVSPKPL